MTENEKIVLDYNDFEFLMRNLDNIISEYSGAQEIENIYIPLYNKLSVYLKDPFNF